MTAVMDEDTVARLQRQQQQMAQSLDKVQSRPLAAQQQAERWEPLTDVVVQGDCLLILMDLPGVDQDKITLRLDEGELVVQGVRGALAEDMVYQRQECPCGAFERRFVLPVGVSQEQLSAQCRQGVLKIRVSGLCAEDQVTAGND